MLTEFALPPELAAHEPPEARGLSRDGVRLLVSHGGSGQISHHGFGEIADLLLPGDLLVVNNSSTIPAAVVVNGGPGGGGLAVHFSSARPDGSWLVELRERVGRATAPHGGGLPGQVLTLPGGALLTLGSRFSGRLWNARLSTAVLPYLLRHGAPIRYSYVERPWPLECYQTVFGIQPGSAEMPSASRPFTPELVTRLASRGVTIAPVTLHTGVSSLEGDEDPYPEPYDVPPVTARLVNLTRASGGRVIAAGTTVVRALESAAVGSVGSVGSGQVAASAGWTSLVITPSHRLRAADGLLTGLHEPRSTHLWMLSAFARSELLERCYEAAAERGYLWHEFGDVHLLLP
ncbi:MAG TPA: S-adenosylmethionine:tRNA ribosyltransferase-isomerase [Streptosporangiaceae bacterium]|jgi:S-adenosylmethionine:tRNA ribosyltransferase-isomerase